MLVFKIQAWYPVTGAYGEFTEYTLGDALWEQKKCKELGLNCFIETFIL